ncbi:DUF2255 family protein [Mammaliicoccus vitulinus]|uniref:DUF2255 family protein n=1 Tax=Mammaliicoccus vitulinus TaxID=71237 RepID=UPI003F958FE8
MVNKWSQEKLKKFKTADDMHVSPFYSDGETLGTPTWIWSVVVEGALYVRAYNGQKSRWYQSAKSQKSGQIKLAGKTYNVMFEPISNTQKLNDAINKAYKDKYGDSAYYPPMVKEGPISATVKISPAD